MVIGRKIHHLNIFQKIFLWFIHFGLRIWYSTLRLQMAEACERILQMDPQASCVFYFWHNWLFAAPKLIRYRRGRTLHGLISASRDGAWLEGLMSFFGIKAIRGSSSWRGGNALMELKRICNQCVCDIIVTPDGPRGPRHRCKAGSLKFAAEAQLPVIFLSFKASNAWTLHSWDRFQIPKPFSKITIRATYCETLPDLPADALVSYADKMLNEFD
ncbi:MAG: lysophospholipid acyltransferase family protein [Puniceicoccales bacterium]|jgi:lysophospholipid acyltransferase (LPLAT)-like uncharacterized protein|nr:lysophospholipid acyltransferase family protein [Puniceicoccales bacterium]